MELFKLFVVVFVSVLLCKGLTVGLLLLCFWIKGRQFHFASDRWDAWFQTAGSKKLMELLAGCYLLSALLATLAAFGLLYLWDFRHALALGVGLFALRTAGSYLRWRHKGRDILEEKLARLCQGAPEG